MENANIMKMFLCPNSAILSPYCREMGKNDDGINVFFVDGLLPKGSCEKSWSVGV